MIAAYLLALGLTLAIEAPIVLLVMRQVGWHTGALPAVTEEQDIKAVVSAVLGGFK